VKHASDGSIDRYKARLVLPGHLQRTRIDCNETYAPLADFTVIRDSLFGMAGPQMDVKCAFLNGNLGENICMSFPKSTPTLKVLYESCRKASTNDVVSKAYLGNVLTRFGMTECQSAPNPKAQCAELMAKHANSEAESSEMRCTPFRAAIGSRLYLSTRPRPDITLAVSILAKHSQDLSPIHRQGVKRVMRYLKGTMNNGLSYSEGESALTVHCDADSGTDDDDRGSRTGIVTFVGNNLISWTSRRQTTTSVSSCEAEYAAFFEAARETAWLRYLMCEIGECPGNVATTMFHDNQGSIAWAEGGMRRVKHVELKYRYTQDRFRGSRFVSNTCLVQITKQMD
jgi:hypothetical protein